MIIDLAFAVFYSVTFTAFYSCFSFLLSGFSLVVFLFLC